MGKPWANYHLEMQLLQVRVVGTKVNITTNNKIVLTLWLNLNSTIHVF